MNLMSVTKGEKSSVVLVVEVDNDSFQSYLDKAFRQNKNDIYVAGFRKGKAPRKVVEGMYGKSVFYDDAINILYPEVLAQACEEAKVDYIGTTVIENLDISDEGVLTLTIRADVYPEVTLGQYKGVEGYKPPAELTEDAIQAEIDSLLERNSRIITVDRPAEAEDTVVIDFEGFIDDVAFEGGQGEAFSLKLGSGTFIPGFEDQLIGTSAGDEKDVVVTFPDGYTEDLAGKTAVFKCKVSEVKTSERPELDDEFAKDVSEFDTLDELKQSLREKQLAAAENDALAQFESNVIEKIVKEMTAEIPDTMIETKLDSLMSQFSAQLQASGIALEDYANMLGADMEMFRANYRPMALAQVQSELVLAKVAELEEITVTDEDYDSECEIMAKQYGMEVDNVKSIVTKDQLEEDIKLTKASRLVLDSAIVTDIEPEDEEPEEKATEEAAEDAAQE